MTTKPFFTEAEAEREAFESWASMPEHQLSIERHKESTNAYDDYTTAWAWEAWQAAAKVGAAKELEQHSREITLLRGERNAAVAELDRLRKAIADKGGDEHSPTQFAYDQVCNALTKEREQHLDEVACPFGLFDVCCNNQGNCNLKDSLEQATQPAAQDRLREALELAVRQNSHDMLMTAEELRFCEAALANKDQS